jgi:DNA polymerase-3 subunit beta
MAMQQNVRLSLQDDGLTLAATDLNISATVRIPSYMRTSNGAVCINAVSLADLVKTMASDEITLIQVGGNSLTVREGESTMAMIGAHSRDFPKLPDATSPEVGLYTRTDAAAFADMLERVAFAVCKDETRFHLNGILIESDGTTTRMVTTDGHRLTRHDCKLECPTLAKGVILPAKAAGEIAKLLKSAGKTDSAYLAIKGCHLYVKVGEWTMTAKLIDAQFPAYDQVIPKDHKKLATVERKAFVAALKRAAKVCLKTRGVKLSFASGKLTLTSDHPEKGTTTEQIKACSDWLERGNTGFFGMNPHYLLDVLGEIDDAWISIAFGDELDPILVRGCDDAISYSVAGSKFLGVVMPMRI